MPVRAYEMPWRPAYETWAGGAWAASVPYFTFLGATAALPWPLSLTAAGFATTMAVRRIRQALKVLTVRASLCGRAMQVIGTDSLARLTPDPNQVFLGYGFEWQPMHSQRLYELASVNYKDYKVSPRLLQALGYVVDPQPDAEIGLPYIHGVEPNEHPLYRPLQNFEGGTLLVGTTQAGKGVALGHFLTQA